MNDPPGSVIDIINVVFGAGARPVVPRKFSILIVVIKLAGHIVVILIKHLARGNPPHRVIVHLRQRSPGDLHLVHLPAQIVTEIVNDRRVGVGGIIRRRRILDLHRFETIAVVGKVIGRAGLDFSGNQTKGRGADVGARDD